MKPHGSPAISHLPQDPHLLTYSQSPKITPWATASFICGLVALPGMIPCMCLIVYTPVAGIAAVLAIVFGTLALRAIGGGGGGMVTGKGFAITGIIGGGLLLLVYLVYLIIILVAFASSLRV